MASSDESNNKTRNLFDAQSRNTADAARPLADRMRPKTLDALIGQEHAVGPGTLIRNAVIADRLFSMILWGPPGSGKTTIARIIAEQTRCHFVHLSAVLTGVKDIRSVIETAKEQQQLYQKRTILFVDEIHRFNKSQQDAFLHHVESGLITLIGATTENPSFEVISALLSRCQVISLDALSEADIEKLLTRAVTDAEKGLGKTELTPSDAALSHIVSISDGDGRAALNALEIAAFTTQSAGRTEITREDLETALQRKALAYDKAGEAHYNLISAFHKSLRGGDPDAALYWLARMMEGGEDPFYIARRMVRFASEDIGNADPRALTLAMDAMAAYRFLGSPEGDLSLAQAAAYLACAPKSNRIYTAYGQIQRTIKKTGTLPVPYHIRNAPTRLMKAEGYAEGYQYPHDYPDAVVDQDYLPDKLRGSSFYQPTDRGYEKIIKERLDYWRGISRKKPKK
ncbi:MAG TPA: replication-associated recombination protein A [Desulfosalsimonadaceae bacterium]|nr:replication-associated recombination protein A [Desulfosalsimonadaceae bacterium]